MTVSAQCKNPTHPVLKPRKKHLIRQSEASLQQNQEDILGGALGGGLTIEHLKRRTGVTDTQLDTEIMEHDLQPLADCFDNVDTYLYQLGLSAGQQTDIKDYAFHRGTQSAMREALRLWRKPNLYAATFQALINITLELREGVVADKLCKYIADKVPAADNTQ